MANFTDPQYQVEEQKVAQGLPAQYQQQLNPALLRQALSQAMLQRGMQPMPEGQTIVTGAGAPNRFVKPALTQQLTPMANLAAGALGLGQSQSDIAGIMMQMQQDRQNAVRQIQGTALSHIGVPAGTDPTSLPGNMSGRYYADVAQQEQQSPFPDIRADSVKHAQIAAELIKEQMGQQGSNARANQEAVVAGSSAPSINQAYRLTPYGQPLGAGEGGLQPNNPQLSTFGGHTVAPEAKTGNVNVGPETLESQLTQIGKTRRMEAAQDQAVKDLLPARSDAVMMGQGAEAADLFLKVLPLARTGAMAVDRNLIAKAWSLVSGSNEAPPASIPATDLARMLAFHFMNTAKNAAGLQSIRSNREYSSMLEATNIDMSNPALESLAQQTRMLGRANLNSYEKRVGLFEKFSAKDFPQDFFSGLHVQPGEIVKLPEPNIQPAQTRLPPGTTDVDWQHMTVTAPRQ